MRVAHFQLANGALGKRLIAVQIMRVKDRAHVAKLWPVMVAISASVHPTSASRVTAVPRRSLNVTSSMPAFLHALPHDARKPSGVHGLPSELSRMIVLCLFLAAAIERGLERRADRDIHMHDAPRTAPLALDCFNRICVPSYADQVSRNRSPCRWPVHKREQ